MAGVEYQDRCLSCLNTKYGLNKPDIIKLLHRNRLQAKENADLIEPNVSEPSELSEAKSLETLNEITANENDDQMQTQTKSELGEANSLETLNETTDENSRITDVRKVIGGKIPYHLTYMLIQVIREQGLYLKDHLPRVLKYLDPELKIPNKLSDLTSKVEKYIESNSEEDKFHVKAPKKDCFFIGSKCSELGINEVYLINCECNEDEICRPKIDPLLISNSVIYELYVYMNQSKKSWNDLSRWVQVLLGLPELPVSLHTFVIRLRKRKTELSRNKNKDNLHAYMQKPFLLPANTHDYGSASFSCPKMNESVVEKKGNEKLKKDLVIVKSLFEMAQEELKNNEYEMKLINEESDELLNSLQTKCNDNETLEKELKKIKIKLLRATEKLEVTLDKLENYNPRNVEKKLERYHVKLEHIEEEHQELKKKLKQSQLKCTKLYSKVTYHRGYSKLFKGKEHSMENEIKDLKDAIKYKQNESENLTLEMQDLKEEQTKFKLRDESGKKYTDATAKCCMNLLELGISSRKVGEAIQIVLRDLVGRDLKKNEFPEKTYVNRLASNMSVLAKIQAAEELLKTANSTLLCDGTSRYGEHTMTFNVALSKKKMKTISMFPVNTEDAQTLLSTTKTIFDDLAEVISSNNEEKVKIFNKMIMNIKNTMTDRCSVNKSYIREFEKFRETIVPFTLENSEELPEETLKNLSSINDFYCGYHLTLGLSDVADSCLKVFENMCTAEDTIIGLSSLSEFKNWSLKNSGTYRTIRAASELLQIRGNPAATRAAEFKSFLTSKSESNKLIPFKGNRFGLLFENASKIMYHKDHIDEFLESITHDNLLIKAVNVYMGTELYMAGIKALSIVYFMIIKPYMKLLEMNKQVSEMSTYYKTLDSKIKLWANDPTDLVSGEAVLFEDIEVDKTTPEYLVTFGGNFDVCESVVSQCLELMMVNFSIVINRQLFDHLKGKHSNPNSDIVSQTQSVPVSSISAEHNFGQMDYLQKLKPNASLAAIESIILYRNNETSQWLEEQSQSKQTELLTKARKLSKSFQNRWRERFREINEKRLNKIRNQRGDKIRKENKKAKERADLIDIVNKMGGQCKTTEDINELILNQSKAIQKLRLQKQVKYFQIVLGLKPQNSKWFQFSDKITGQYSISQLKLNLINLIENLNKENVPSTTETTGAENVIKSLEERNILCNVEKQKLKLKLSEMSNQSIEISNKQTGISKKQTEISKKQTENIKKKLKRKASSAVCSDSDIVKKKPKTKRTCELGVISVDTLSRGDFVAVAFNDNWYPGQIEGLENNSITINYLQRCKSSNSNFQWPSKKDEQITGIEYIFLKLQHQVNHTAGSSRLSSFSLSFDNFETICNDYNIYKDLYF